MTVACVRRNHHMCAQENSLAMVVAGTAADGGVSRDQHANAEGWCGSVPDKNMQRETGLDKDIMGMLRAIYYCALNTPHLLSWQ